MKKNCENCIHLEWIDGDIGDESGLVCNARDYLYNPHAERRHLEQLDNEAYRQRPKKCCELKKPLVERPQKHLANIAR